MNALTSTALVARSPRKPIWERETALRSELRLGRVRAGEECPTCGEHDGIEDNGERGHDRTFRCCSCGDQWDRFFGSED